MHSDKVFEQGMRRANKTEEKARRGRGGGGGGRGGPGGGGRGRGGYSANSQNNYPPLQPSLDGPGVTQFHSANGKRGREMAARGGQHGGYLAPYLLDGGRGDVKAPRKENAGLSDQMKSRLQALDDEDADYFTI